MQYKESQVASRCPPALQKRGREFGVRGPLCTSVQHPPADELPEGRFRREVASGASVGEWQKLRREHPSVHTRLYARHNELSAENPPRRDLRVGEDVEMQYKESQVASRCPPALQKRGREFGVRGPLCTSEQHPPADELPEGRFRREVASGASVGEWQKLRREHPSVHKSLYARHNELSAENPPRRDLRVGEDVETP
ncbi:UNVERIFIED_CONTAM: hypothetical protein RMT77_018150 [Armadillidium vulgare]